MARSTLNVSLTPELNSFVASLVASGLYVTSSEVIREGLRLLQEREALRRQALAEVRRKVEVGLEQAERGETIAGVTVFEELEARLAKLEASRA